MSRFLSCRCGVIPREVAWAFCGLELSSAWGTLRCLYGAFGALCGALRCSAFEMPYVVVPLRCLCSAPCCGSSEMSHVIPSRVFQGLKSHRWNCNVFLDPKKSEGTQITCDFWGGARPGHPNYVRLLIRQARGSNSCVRSSAEDAAHTPPRLCVLPAYAEQSLRPERIGLKAQTSPCTRCW